MANGNGEDLVSQVVVTGTEDSLAKLNAYADGGAQAFDKIAVAADTAAAGVAGAAAKIDTAGTVASKGFNTIGSAANSTRDVPGKIKDIENAISSFTSRLPQLTNSLGRFSQRLAIVGTAAVAVGIKLAEAAARVAKTYDGQNDSLQKNTQAQIDANNASLTAETAQINYNESLRQLKVQLDQGKISYSQYTSSVKQLNTDYTDQQRVALQVAAAQEEVKRQNDALTKSLKDREAYSTLINTFGGPLLQSLVSFGRQVQALHTQFINAFGPGAAAFIDTLSATLSRNSGAITNFFNAASKQVTDLLKTSGPQLQKLLENIGAAVATVFTGVLNAAPGVIDFFNNVLVPAISKVAGIFQGIATALNAVFGTQLTGGSIVLIALLAQVTGSLRVMFALIRAGGAVFKGLVAIVESVGVAIGEIFGIKAVAQVTKLGGAVVKSGGPIKSFLAIIRTAIPLITTLGGAVAAALGIGFIPAIAIIAAVTAALIFMLTKVDWKNFAANASSAIKATLAFLLQLLQGAKNIATGIIAGFRAVNTFFADLGTAIAAFFAAAWQAVVSGVSAAVAGVIAGWNAVGVFFSTLVQTIVTFFTTLWTSITTGVTTAVTAVTTLWNTAAEAVKTAWNGVVAFFQGVVDSIKQFFTDLWNNVTSAFRQAIDSLKSAFNDLLAFAKATFQPILDILQAIADLVASVGGAAGGDSGGTVKAATGGHIRGPGTGTSDSIPAWLSDGEYVVKAKSVARYGVGFLNALNQGLLKAPKFNMGGLVSGIVAPVPRFAFADGGKANANSATLRPVNLNLFGQAFNGLLAPEDVGERLTKFAVERQTKSAGRKPAWLGRGRN